MVAASAVIAALSLTACSRGHHVEEQAAPPTAASYCPEPAQGARFSLCGTIASARPQGSSESGRSLSGSLDSMPQLSGTRFVVKGGTLNAIR
jgi:hypothetical protein